MHAGPMRSSMSSVEGKNLVAIWRQTGRRGADARRGVDARGGASPPMRSHHPPTPHSPPCLVVVRVTMRLLALLLLALVAATGGWGRWVAAAQCWLCSCGRPHRPWTAARGQGGLGLGLAKPRLSTHAVRWCSPPTCLSRSFQRCWPQLPLPGNAPAWGDQGSPARAPPARWSCRASSALTPPPAAPCPPQVLLGGS